MRETWYVLEGGEVADPRECSLDNGGRLTHKSGVAVEMRGETPRSRGVDADQERAKAEAKDMKPEEPKRGYKTRESKAN